ncbi:MAG: hypothetical protein LBJ11_08000 [Oscillospiraceae bacterium]|jgi:hypothetical protein|nr:hypothetical protein [Oscillospiraceae bacterium]
MPNRFEQLRAAYPVFRYENYRVTREEDSLLLRFDFAIDGLGGFHPETRIFLGNLPLRNPLDSPVLRELVFSLGLVEAVSYWKCACPPRFIVACGGLAGEDRAWWKRLWYHGLGEFFYRNGIKTDEEHFLALECSAGASPPAFSYQEGGLSLIPVGGGKDSCVTLELLREAGRQLMGFTVNDQPARRQTFAAAGFPPEQMLRVQRMIDPALLRRNAEGFWNGHTPFSAVVAFLGLIGAYLIGAGELILSNEASANEASVPGTDVNHQYSKSFAFERDMNDYIGRRFRLPIRYFSLLRPFHELQIARQFAALPQYHDVFRSCNAGSKQNVWCGSCAKCLFVALMLAPFLPPDALWRIFGADLLDAPQLREDLRGLLGQGETKPFECVGTIQEAQAALCLAKASYRADGLPLPLLLRELEAPAMTETAALALLRERNPEHMVPAEFRECVERMGRRVGDDSFLLGK